MATLVDGGLGEALRQCSASRFSGTLRVEGRPGGTLCLADGAICACETPGAPGAEVIALRSGRIPEPAWNAALSAAAVSGCQLAEEIVGRELLGAGELEALLRTCLADAVFAVLSGQVTGWDEEPGTECPLPLSPAADAGWLLAEASRRGKVLAALPAPALNAQARVVAVRGTAGAARGGGQGHDQLLALADGRRTARDLAFALGRGLYETLLALARLRAGNMLVISSCGLEPPSAAGAPGGNGEGSGETQTQAGLPRRVRGLMGTPRAAEPGRRAVVPGARLLRPRVADDGNAPDMADHKHSKN